MLYIRQASQKYYANLKKNHNLEHLMKINEEIKFKIEINKEILSQKVFEFIKISNNKKKLFILRRKIYNTFDEYILPEELKIDCFLQDLSLRKKYKENIKKINLELFENEENVKRVIKKKLLDSNFNLKFYIANEALYNIIKSNKIIKKNAYLTILKYLYKEEVICTPSYYWSGISKLITQDDFDYENKKTKYFIEENSHIKKYIDKDKVKNDILNNNKIIEYFYFNLTLYRIKDNFYYYEHSFESISKIEVSCNEFLIKVYDEYRYKFFKYDEIISILNNYTDESIEMLIMLLDKDIIKIKNNIKYGNNNIYDVSNKTDIKYKGFRKEEYILNLKDNIIDSNKENKILKIFNKNFKLYKSLYSTFYSKEKNREYEENLKYFKNKKMNLLEFLYVYNCEEKSNLNIKKINYRKWYIPRNLESKEIYFKFINKIKDKIILEKGNVIKLDIKEYNEFISNIKEDTNKNELIYQLSFKDEVFIPEMISTTPGRLFGRYKKYYSYEIQNKIENLIYKNISRKNVQCNIEINNFKDNIGFELKKIEKKLSLYNLENEDDYNLENIYVLVKNDEICFIDKNEKEINFYLNSAVSPGEDSIYRLINVVNKGRENIDLNGHAFTRLELDLDYQPRILLDNLLLSRERIRIRVNDLKNIIQKKNSELELFLFLKSKNIMYEYYCYTDVNYKPKYGRLYNTLDINILKKEILKANEYIFFEEVYPNYIDNNDIIEYNFEIWGIENE